MDTVAGLMHSDATLVTGNELIVVVIDIGIADTATISSIPHLQSISHVCAEISGMDCVSTRPH